MGPHCVVAMVMVVTSGFTLCCCQGDGGHEWVHTVLLLG